VTTKSRANDNPNRAPGQTLRLMTCRICENAKDNKTFRVREMMFGFREWFLYFQCAKCGSLQIAKFPSNISKYYPANYYSYTESPSKQFNNPMKNIFKKIRDRYAIFGKGVIGRILYAKFPNEFLRRSLSGVADLRKNTRILDVGCGVGSLLYTLKENGFEHLLGIDPFLEQSIEYENGLKILKKTIRELDGEWDVIMFHHSFEHLPDPLETLQSVAELLSKNGICLIRTPTVSSFAWEHYGVNWVGLDAPRHFFLHSIESIKMLAQKTNLKLEKIIYDSTEFQFWGSEQYLRDIPLMSEQSYGVNPSRSIFSNGDITKFKKMAEKLNFESRGDTTAFYLTKNSFVT
jgi:2-polyprenyl-3-methyl-5-hydroxy-6-metoxy-1,4-benzoquinol methylase